MSCLKKGCTLDGSDDRMVICWLCHGLCHYKCCGLSGLVGESVSKNKYLHWRCNGCQKISVEFYRFFQSTRNNFLQIQNNLNHLNDQINAYGKLFNDFKSLDDLQSPTPSPTRRKSPRFLNSNNASTSSVGLTNPLQKSSTNAKEVFTDGSIPSSIATPKIIDTVIHFPNNDSNMKPPTDSTTLLPDPVTTARLINLDATSPVPTTSTSVNHQNIPNEAAVNHEMNSDAHPRELRTISPKKTIFATRFAVDTIVEDMKFYILSKIKNCSSEEILIFKII